MKKILVPNSVHTRPGQENFKKNRKKKSKKLKNHFPELFLDKTGVACSKRREKRILPLFRFILGLGMKIPRKIAKKLKTLKNLILALFLVKTRLDKPRKREKNIIPKFRSYSTRARKLRKKLQKNYKN